MLVAAGGINWTLVIVAIVAAIPGTIAALFGAANRRSLRTASGDPLGQVVERAHDLSAVGLLAAGLVQPGPKMDEAVRRLNGDVTSPVKVTLTPDVPPSEPKA